LRQRREEAVLKREADLLKGKVSSYTVVRGVRTNIMWYETWHVTRRFLGSLVVK
jgi:hypothetical protein